MRNKEGKNDSDSGSDSNLRPGLWGRRHGERKVWGKGLILNMLQTWQSDLIAQATVSGLTNFLLWFMQPLHLKFAFYLYVCPEHDHSHIMGVTWVCMCKSISHKKYGSLPEDEKQGYYSLFYPH